MGRFEPSDRHSEDMIAAVEHAAEHLAHTMREGFKLLALQIAAGQGVNNSKAIEIQAAKLNSLTSKLKKSTTT